jgi:type IV pilus biogenesis protein CpaD/CtpE
MTSWQVRLVVRALGAAALAGALSGCFLNPDAMPPNNVRKIDQLYHSFIRLQPTVIEPQVEPITMVHRVDFAYGSDELSAEEKERLDAFLADTGANSRARIEVDGPRRAGGAHDLMTDSRLNALIAYLSSKGLQAAAAPRPTETLTQPEDAVVVTVSRAMVIEPDCNVPKTIYAPRPTNIWSCTTSAALGRMVADPTDLQSGRPTGPGDGEALIQGVERYRKDKIKPLKTESTN